MRPRKTKDGRERTDILGKALMNYAIPDTYAVRYQLSDIAHKAKRPQASENISGIVEGNSENRNDWPSLSN